jgi:hypothetical protein
MEISVVDLLIANPLDAVNQYLLTAAAKLSGFVLLTDPNLERGIAVSVGALQSRTNGTHQRAPLILGIVSQCLDRAFRRVRVQGKELPGH